MSDGGGKLGKARRLTRACEALLCQSEVLLRADLGINIEANHVPLNDRSVRVAHRRGARFDPAVFAVMTPQTVATRVGLSGYQAVGVFVLYCSEVVRVDACVQCLHQAGPTRLIKVLQLVSQELAKLLAPVYRLAIRCCAVNHGRQGFYELPKEPLSLEQGLLRLHLLFNVNRDDIPLHDLAICIAQGLRPGFYPSIDPITAASAESIYK